MAKFKKAILHANETYHSPDGAVPVTTDRLKNWETNFQKVTAAGYAVPVAWDHASDIAGASPVKLSSKGKLPSAKNTVGKLAGFKVAQDGSHAEILLDITDPTAKGRCERNEVCVSPIIFDKWLDGAKTEYSDVLTHVDLVTWPVDHSQKPFIKAEPGVIACGIRMGLTRMALPEDDDADEVEDGKPGDTDTAPEKPPENPDLPKDDSGDQIAEAIVAHLQQLGVALPAAWTLSGDNAGEILLTGLKTAVLAKQTAEPKKDDEPEEEEETMTVQDPGIATMSLQVKSQLAFAERQHRETIKTRLSALADSGRCTPAEATAKESELPGVRLSLTEAGEPVPSDLEKWIASREAVPVGTFWSPEVKTQKLSLVAHQPQINTGEDPAGDQKVVDWALGRSKRPA